MNKQILTQITGSVLVASLVILSTGCASIVDGGPGKVSINSQPDGAKVLVMNSKGQQVVTGTTPTELRLDRGTGYFTKAKYTVRIEKEGYRPVEVKLEGKLNSWYLGNLLFGGLIGLLIVDPISGAMWHLEPGKIDTSLTSGQAGLSHMHDGLVVVLKDQVTEEQLASANRIVQ